ncbi:molecular chaperone [Proteus columbae]|uniref:fimbrial biogenesis chaperone n=1 Tax=Proteus columbae TaxID=1987580 RepID=UPI00288AA954|nr:molecular chaperone [Proteus columbae]
MVKKIKFSLFALIFSLLNITLANASVGLETTRLIYNENDKSGSLVAFNNNKELNYLIQSWIVDKDNNISDEFIITPPVLKVQALNKNTLDITKIKETPNNKESLYWVNVKFIAPGNKNDENVLRYTIINKIKLIYRPTVLQDLIPEKAVEQLTVKTNNGFVSIYNPTGVYINLSGALEGDKKIETPSYIEPFSEIKVSANLNKSFSINYINDLGKVLSHKFN